jgi:hypothetical protein
MHASYNREMAKYDLGSCVVKWKGHSFRDRRVWFESSFNT